MIMRTEEKPVRDMAPRANGRGTVSFTARDITGLHEVTVSDMPAAAQAGQVARSVANRLNLPVNVPWSLRDDRSGEYLKDDADLASQVPETGANLTITPRTHLG